MRSSLFFLILCGWCQRRAQISLSAGEAPALVTSNLMVEGLTLLLGLKLIWITAVDPLHLSGAS